MNFLLAVTYYTIQVTKYRTEMTLQKKKDYSMYLVVSHWDFLMRKIILNNIWIEFLKKSFVIVKTW
jgi:hypothetical protein